MRLNEKIIVHISTDDKKRLKKEADKLGLSLSSYCRAKLLSEYRIIARVG